MPLYTGMVSIFTYFFSSSELTRVIHSVLLFHTVFLFKKFKDVLLNMEIWILNIIHSLSSLHFIEVGPCSEQFYIADFKLIYF